MNEPQERPESDRRPLAGGACGAPAVDALAAIDALIGELMRSSRAATQAWARIRLHERAGTRPDPGDRETFDAWLSAAIALASLSCTWTDPQLKAQGAHLHHLAHSLDQNAPRTP